MENAKIAFEELFDINEIQRLQDEYAAATGVASIITHPDGTPITAPSNFTHLCSQIIRKTEKGCANCQRSDAVIGSHHPNGPIMQQCLSGGLWDAGAAITVGGHHIANWLIGQVRDETQTEEKMRAYAREIGADEPSFMKAFRDVPAMSREQFERIAKVLFTLASQLSTTAYQNVQQARFISERRRAEEALRASEERFRMLFEQSADPSLLIRGDVFVDCNKAAVEILHAPSKDELLHTHPWEISPERQPDGRRSKEKAGELLARVERAGALRFEWMHRRWNGEEFPVEVSLTALRDGGEMLIYTVWRDIAERKQAETEIKESEEKYRTLVESIPQKIYTKNRQSVYMTCNENFTRDLGITAEELAGKTDYNFFPRELADKYRSDDMRIMGSGKTEALEEQYIRKGKTAWAYTVKTPIRDKAGDISGIMGVFSDITEHKREEAEKERLREQLHHSQKMESVGRLAGGVAHDFNNMLGVILGYAELALAKVDPSEPLFNHLQEIFKATKRSAHMTRQLLAFARKQTIAPKVLDLNETVEGMLKIIRRLIGEDIDMVWLPAANLWPVKIDPSQLDQILANLCINSRDAISGQGKITIETKNVSFDEACCANQSGCVPGEFALLAVSDNGCGMDRKTMEMLFEPFFTTKGVGQGTGLGLATVYGSYNRTTASSMSSANRAKARSSRSICPGTPGKLS